VKQPYRTTVPTTNEPSKLLEIMDNVYHDNVQDPSSPSPQPGFPDVDKRSCQLFGTTALIVQALMGVLVILSLVFKRYREKPRRPWRIWLFDVSKQVVGQMFLHGVNVLVSVASQDFSANACVFYFLNVLLDTTLGVAIIYALLHLMAYVLTEKLHLQGFESGQYGTPPSLMFWARQAAIYVLALTAMKFAVLGLLILLPFLSRFGEWLLSWTYTRKGDSLQVVFVMGLFPIIMNILQFWLIDSIVKASAAVRLLEEEDRHDSDVNEPLFRASNDDDDEGPGHRPRNDVENPRTPSRSKSPPVSISPEDKVGLTPQDSKSVASSSSATLPVGQQSRQHLSEEHSYPPSLSSSITSSSSSSSPTSRELSPSVSGGQTFKRRRSPPRPLNLNIVRQPAINSPLFSAPPLEPSNFASMEPPTVIKSQITSNPPNVRHSQDDWDAGWGDDGQDWADRVGNEEWTGRRIENVKASLKDDLTPATGILPVNS
jgi:cytoskeletal protein RodZ